MKNLVKYDIDNANDKLWDMFSLNEKLKLELKKIEVDKELDQIDRIIKVSISKKNLIRTINL